MGDLNGADTKGVTDYTGYMQYGVTTYILLKKGWKNENLYIKLQIKYLWS